MVAAIEQGYPQREIAESAYRHQQAVDEQRTLVVGVNAFVAEQEPRLPILYIDDAVGETQVASVAAIKATRDNARVDRSPRGDAGRRACRRPADGADPRCRARVRHGRRNV